MPPIALPDLPPDAPVADWLPSVLTAAAAKLQANVGHDDPEAVHDQRVGTRRLRSHLRTFERLLDEAWAEELRSELAWLADEIGEVRDLDVLLEWLGDRSTPRRPELEHQRAAASTALRATYRSDRAERLLASVADAVEAPAFAPGLATWQPAVNVAVPLVGRTWRRLRKKVQALPADPADGQLHRVRIRAKRCRYGAEAVEPLVGGAAARSAKALAKLQDVLGEHHDTVVAEVVLHDDPALVAALRQERQILRSQWPTAWTAAEDCLQEWLG